MPTARVETRVEPESLARVVGRVPILAGGMVAENPSEMRGVEARAARGRHLGRTRAGQLINLRTCALCIVIVVLSLALQLGTPLHAYMAQVLRE